MNDPTMFACPVHGIEYGLTCSVQRWYMGVKGWLHLANKEWIGGQWVSAAK